MRLRPLIKALSAALSTLWLAACASTPAAAPPKAVSQSGLLKVHPGLLGQQAPGEAASQDPARNRADATR